MASKPLKTRVSWTERHLLRSFSVRVLCLQSYNVLQNTCKTSNLTAKHFPELLESGTRKLLPFALGLRVSVESRGEGEGGSVGSVNATLAILVCCPPGPDIFYGCVTLFANQNSKMVTEATLSDHQFKPVSLSLPPADSDDSALFGLQVSLLIRRELFERAKDFNIILDDVAITELSFSREYTAAVEAKQVGECELPRAATRWPQLLAVPLSLTGVPLQPSRRRSAPSSTWRKPSRTRNRRSSRLKEKLRPPRW